MHYVLFLYLELLVTLACVVFFLHIVDLPCACCAHDKYNMVIMTSASGGAGPEESSPAEGFSRIPTVGPGSASAEPFELQQLQRFRTPNGSENRSGVIFGDPGTVIRVFLLKHDPEKHKETPREFYATSTNLLTYCAKNELKYRAAHWRANGRLTLANAS